MNFFDWNLAELKNIGSIQSNILNWTKKSYYSPINHRRTVKNIYILCNVTWWRRRHTRVIVIFFFSLLFAENCNPILLRWNANWHHNVHVRRHSNVNCQLPFFTNLCFSIKISSGQRNTLASRIFQSDKIKTTHSPNWFSPISNKRPITSSISLSSGANPRSDHQ